MTSIAGRFAGPTNSLSSDQVVALHSMEAMLAKVGSWSPAWTSPEVLAVRHGFEVGGIDATPVPAEVVELEPFGDRTLDQLVRHTVSVEPPRWFGARADLSVADHLEGHPRPASIGSAALVHLGPEALSEWDDRSRHAYKSTPAEAI